MVNTALVRKADGSRFGLTAIDSPFISLVSVYIHFFSFFSFFFLSVPARTLLILNHTNLLCIDDDEMERREESKTKQK